MDDTLYNYIKVNIYARFFAHDTLVHSIEELIAFLDSIPDIEVTQQIVDDVTEYINSDMPYPKRYKIRPRVYFILIKTTAQTMEEFKANRKNKELDQELSEEGMPLTPKEIKAAELAVQRTGWYRGYINFKRVVLMPDTGKFRYEDTPFEAFVWADSGNDCYNRIITHLKYRPDLDMRSQFPAARGSNFEFEYIGEELPSEEEINAKDNRQATDEAPFAPEDVDADAPGSEEYSPSTPFDNEEPASVEYPSNEAPTSEAPLLFQE